MRRLLILLTLPLTLSCQLPRNASPAPLKPIMSVNPAQPDRPDLQQQLRKS
ncbi:MAG TPA: hypothetical protein VF669_22880 [Tepidisphaeraceae bacterium]|jgi:hypothetical protein